jgi:hypothetical protein
LSVSQKPIHPEATDREVWIGNMFGSDFIHVGWTSKRMGKIAYDVNGKVIPGFRPIFVARVEVEASGIAIPASGPLDHRW